MGDIKGRKESKGNFQIIVSQKKSTKKLLMNITYNIRTLQEQIFCPFFWKNNKWK